MRYILFRRSLTANGTLHIRQYKFFLFVEENTTNEFSILHGICTGLIPFSLFVCHTICYALFAFLNGKYKQIYGSLFEKNRRNYWKITKCKIMSHTIKSKKKKREKKITEKHNKMKNDCGKKK